jgi:hypothetical protein
LVDRTSSIKSLCIGKNILNPRLECQGETGGKRFEFRVPSFGLKPLQRFSALKRSCQKSLPSSLFQREESFGEFLPFFPLWEKEEEGGFDGFSKG